MTERKMDALFDALELLGDEEGTEEQLERTVDLLRCALETMSTQEADDFLDSEDVAELLEDYSSGRRKDDGRGTGDDD